MSSTVPQPPASVPNGSMAVDASLLAEIVNLAPSFMCVLRGPGHTFELVNDRYRQLVGGREVIGKTVVEALPEVRGQGFVELLDGVFRTGVPHAGRGVPVMLASGPGRPLVERVVDFVYQPIREPGGAVTGVFVHGIDVTEQALSERGLRDGESRFRQLADAMPQIVFSATPDGNVDYFNRRWYEYTGLPDGSVGYESWRQVLQEPDRSRTLELWPAALRTGDAYEIEYRLRRRDGEYRWHLGRALPVRDAEGKIVRWFGTNTDIHDLKLAEANLQYSRQQMELVVRGANVGVWYCPLPFDRLIWDETVKSHFFLAPHDEVTIDTFYDRIHPDDRARTRESIDRSIAAREGYEIDYRTVSPDGERTKWVRAIGRAFYDAEGRPVRFDGITIDVTERVRTEIALRESERRFRNMSDHAPVMIWVTRPDGYCEYLNRQWYDFTGQTEAESAGFGWVNATHPDDAQRVGDAFMEANADRAAFMVEYRLRRVDGTYRWCVDAARPRFSDQGEFLGYVGSVIDITDRAIAEQERAALLEGERAARLEAERVSRLKDEFLATLSHELRTPLNAILGWSQVLKMSSGNDPEDLEQGLATIERNARAQSQIIEDLLDMSRIISGKVRLDVQRLDLASIVNAAVDTVRPTADTKGVRLRAVVDPLPGVSVSGDPGRMQQVLWNLLSNAVKFTPKGGSVQVVLERVHSHIELSVTDTGEGIKPGFLPFVFDRFRQADASTTRRHGGMGLGLSIVKQLVELHGGTVQARSAGTGLGAKFVVTIPLTVISDPDAPDAADTLDRRHPTGDSASSTTLQSASADLSGVRVLVVDDEPDARSLVARLLTDRGATATTAGSAAEAMALLTATVDAPGGPRFDVLVSDIGMPGEDGYTLVRRVRALGRTEGGAIPAIALTAYARAQDRIKAIAAGFQMHVAKPVEPVELLTMVASAAGRMRT